LSDFVLAGHFTNKSPVIFLNEFLEPINHNAFSICSRVSVTGAKREPTCECSAFITG
jgi:hypothetical protein